MKKYPLFVLLISALPAFYARAENPAPAGPQDGPVLILHANVHTGTGMVIRDAAIGFDELKLRLRDLGTELGLAIDAQHEDVFRYMHRV